MAGIGAVLPGGVDGKFEGQHAAAILQTADRVADAAAALDQPEWIGEALQIAIGVADPAAASQIEQKAAMIADAMVRRSRLASLHCRLVAAEAALAGGRTGPATEHLNAAAMWLSRRDVVAPRLDAYRQWLIARVSAAGGNAIGTGGSTDAAITAMRSFALDRRLNRQPAISMPWTLQVAAVGQRLGRNLGNESARRTVAAYAVGPDSARWRRDPVDAMTGVLSDRQPLHRALLQLNVASQDASAILTATDGLLADRITAGLPLGGRVAAVRLLVSTPPGQLSEAQRTVLATAPPALAALADAVAADAQRPDAPAAGAGGVPTRPSDQSGPMEAAISSLALARGLAPPGLPPAWHPADAAAMSPKTALMTFVFVENQLVGTLTQSGGTEAWLVGGSNRLAGSVAKLLASLGVAGTRGRRVLDPTAWQSVAAGLRDTLMRDAPPLSPDVQTLLVVPDGPLWYLPMELLFGEPLPGDGADVPRRVVRYAVTPGLAARPALRSDPGQTAVVVGGRLLQPRDLDVERAMIQSVADAAPGSIVAAADSIADLPRIGRGVGTVAMATLTGADGWQEWLRLPAGGPSAVLLPGHRTAAVTGRPGDGSEIAGPISFLQLSGVGDVMIARWPTGGGSAAAILSELLPEIPHVGLSEAMQRAVQIARTRELSIDTEPLLGKADDPVPPADHPLFWAGYLTTGTMDLPEPKPAGG